MVYLQGQLLCLSWGLLTWWGLQGFTTMHHFCSKIQKSLAVFLHHSQFSHYMDMHNKNSNSKPLFSAAVTAFWQTGGEVSGKQEHFKFHLYKNVKNQVAVLWHADRYQKAMLQKAQETARTYSYTVNMVFYRWATPFFLECTMSEG